MTTRLATLSVHASKHVERRAPRRTLSTAQSRSVSKAVTRVDVHTGRASPDMRLASLLPAPCLSAGSLPAERPPACLSGESTQNDVSVLGCLGWWAVCCRGMSGADRRATRRKVWVCMQCYTRWSVIKGAETGVHSDKTGRHVRYEPSGVGRRGDAVSYR